jgi:hypothetical protein
LTEHTQYREGNNNYENDLGTYTEQGTYRLIIEEDKILTSVLKTSIKYNNRESRGYNRDNQEKVISNPTRIHTIRNDDPFIYNKIERLCEKLELL